ncbi:hypothetical protein SISSUDRAFT_161530 [Sistotremastrum suecicum HHB10207 ss-3]|uniref:Uncharacterized protein n=1 Tax=Sistotremastrum suecicum HHB10207 ss-3 TaxID=1314776 RepID=A0A166AMZ2_9AGAM|nr:hypothetical protein SISSUDRAFT_161530 [Sistotremastrum suecicum HHB10207 ss-3]
MILFSTLYIILCVTYLAPPLLCLFCLAPPIYVTMYLLSNFGKVALYADGTMDASQTIHDAKAEIINSRNVKRNTEVHNGSSTDVDVLMNGD